MGESSKANAEQFFRCPVHPEAAPATLICGRRKIPVMLQDTSIDGFTISLKAKDALRLRVGRDWILQTQSERVLVRARWMFHPDDGMVQLAIARIRELDYPNNDFEFLAQIRRVHDGRTESNRHELAFAGIVISLFLALSLPGLGDRLGTAQRIQSGLRAITNYVGIF